MYSQRVRQVLTPVQDDAIMDGGGKKGGKARTRITGAKAAAIGGCSDDGFSVLSLCNKQEVRGRMGSESGREAGTRNAGGRRESIQAFEHV
jgi:hypothetical protein